MSRVVTGSDVWPTIAKLLANGGPRRCAVAYLGADAGDLLSSLRRGDLVICDASPRALKTGATHPAALRALVDRHVTVRSRPHLHAKVYISGADAFVGSANASATAVKNDEAGVLVTGARAVADLAAYVDGLATAEGTTKVDDTFIQLAEKLYRPPVGGAGHGAGGPAGRTLWFQSYGDEPPKSVVQAAEQQRGAWGSAPGDVSATLDYSWGSKGAWSIGGMCVWIARGCGDATTWLAEPPAVCVHRHPVGGSSRQWVYWWRTPAAKPIKWSRLRQHVLTHAGVSLDADGSTRSATAVDAVFDLFKLSRTETAGDKHIA